MASTTGTKPSRIDRRALVTRHNVVLTRFEDHSPLQVGNGEFAFGVDFTGLQTFTPFATMSHWGWHSAPLPPGQRIEDFHGLTRETHGRPVVYPMIPPDQQALGQWLYANPHRINLGRIGLEMRKLDGTPVTTMDIQNARQELDLWSGAITSRFEIGGSPVVVMTCCHPTLDLIAVSIQSPLLAAGRLSVRIEFPGADDREFAALVGDWDHPDRYWTTLQRRGDHRADFTCQLDATLYHAALVWQGAAGLSEQGRHRYRLMPPPAWHFEFVCAFAPHALPAELPSTETTAAAARRHWERFWNSGGAIDLSGSVDSRWHELERRIVLSQYLMAVNEAGTLPPQESGLVNNGWNGKFHLEMTWWHAAHWALWNRWPKLNRSLGFYHRLLPSARQRALAEGYRGARWPKCTGPEGRESPHPIHAWLIWQQPHPIFFAELDYRSHPTRVTLAKWREIVFATADFLASYAYHDPHSGRAGLGPPLYVVSENTDPKTTRNPAFELAYWRFGLRVAQEWRERLGMSRDPEWDRTLQTLAPLPQQEGLYVLHEGIADMWTKWNWEHPALTGIYGMLPGDGVNTETMRRTLEKVVSVWDFNRTWGWDFPMLAMCAARLGEGERAVDLLLHPAAGFQFNARGLATGGPFPYFPSNGGLLYAVALMAGGWTDAPHRHAPGFPDNGQWAVRSEGLRPAL